jgi:hypothetical protein
MNSVREDIINNVWLRLVNLCLEHSYIKATWEVHSYAQRYFKMKWPIVIGYSIFENAFRRYNMTYI